MTTAIVDRQTYLGLEMTSSGRYTYAREILSKKAYKVLATIKRFLSNSDTATISIKNKLFDALVKPILLYGCDIKASIFSYLQGLKHTAKNSLLCEAFQYATNYATFFNILNNGDSIRKYSSESTLTSKTSRKLVLIIKKSLRNEYARHWLEA